MVAGLRLKGSAVSYEFTPSAFVEKGYETASGDWHKETRKQFKTLRATYPELSRWGDLALGQAWGDYSQDIYAVSWLNEGFDQRDNGFLAYIYVLTLRPGFDFGGMGLYTDEILKYGEMEPWKTPETPLPKWTARGGR